MLRALEFAGESMLSRYVRKIPKEQCTLKGRVSRGMSQ